MFKKTATNPAILRFYLAMLVGVVLFGCVLAVTALFLYKPAPSADALVYLYEHNQAFGIFTIRPDGSKTLPLVYSNPIPARLVASLAGISQAVSRPLGSILRQNIPLNPAWIAGGSQIAYRVRVHGQNCDQIVRMEANGGNPNPILCLSRDYRDEAVAWSPDGSRLTTAHREGNRTILAVLDSTGNMVHYSYHPETVWGVSWSPDSARIAVTLDGEASLIIIEQDFTMRTFRPDAAAFGQPAWSPDGEKIAFFCVSSERIDICSIGADGTESRRILLPEGFPYLKYHLRWSPAGNQLLFEANQPTGYNDLFLVNVDGSDLRQLTFHPAADAQPTWSPDGLEIAFVSRRDGNWEIYRIREDGTGLTRVTNTPGDEREPAWRPD